MESKKITIIIEQGENGYLVGQIKDYPAAISQGRTINELLDNLKDALKLVLDDDKADISALFSTWKDNSVNARKLRKEAWNRLNGKKFTPELPDDVNRELTEQEEKEVLLLNLKINAAKTFGDKI
jgi:predicted RNase H-like HicB family nuclease